MNLAGLTDRQRSEAVLITEQLKAELEPLVIGRTAPPWSCYCGCGALSHEDTTVAAVSSPNEYGCPDLDASYCSWFVDVGAAGDDGRSIGIDRFMSKADLDAMFERHWRSFCELNIPGKLAQAEARMAPGGDLYRANISIWF